MPRVERRHPRRREWHDGHFHQLRSGWDYFSDGWGDPVHPPAGVTREQWPTPEILDDMRACWQQNRDEIKQLNFDHFHFYRPTWGEKVFDQGMTPDEAFGLGVDEDEDDHET